MAGDVFCCLSRLLNHYWHLAEALFVESIRRTVLLSQKECNAMIHRLITYLATAVTNASAFSTVPWTSTKTETLPATTRTRLSLSSSSPSSPSSRVDSVAAIVVDDVTADDVTCYITNDEEIALEGEKPHVVCTSEPEEVSRSVYSYTRVTMYLSRRHDHAHQ